MGVAIERRHVDGMEPMTGVLSEEGERPECLLPHGGFGQSITQAHKTPRRKSATTMHLSGTNVIGIVTICSTRIPAFRFAS